MYYNSDLFIIVSNGLVYKIKSIEDHKKFPYRKYLIRKLYNRKDGEAQFIFLDWEGKTKTVTFGDIEIFEVSWLNNTWNITLIDHKTQAYYNLELNDKDNFPDYNFFSLYLFPELDKLNSEKDKTSYFLNYHIDKINKKLELISDRIKKLEYLNS